MIDYKAYESLVAHLTDSFESKPMHRIFDCVGSDELFQRSAKYLDKDGVFITVVGGVGAGPIVRSKLLPVALGGVPRRYKLLALWPDGANAKEVARWIENGEYSKFPRDSEYSMQDAIKVWLSTSASSPDCTDKRGFQGYERVASKRSRGKVVVAVS